jgi:branched-chain amino acid transport system substrate-binding protein
MKPTQRTTVTRALALLAVLLMVASCGTRRSHDEVMSAFGTGSRDGFGTQTTTDNSSSGNGGEAGSGTSTTLGPGATAPAGGSTPGGSTTGGGQRTATTAAASGQAPAAGPTCPNGPLAPVNIGHIGGYEGLVGATLNGGLEVAQIWAKSVNSRGGLNCHPVNLIAVNDRNDPNTNASLVRQLVEQKSVIAFVGNLTPLSLSGGLSYLQQKGVPIVGGDLVHPAWISSPIVFPQGLASDLGAAASMQQGVKVARQRGLPNPDRTAMFVCEVEACTSAGGSVAAHNGEGYNLVYRPNISIVQTNFANECMQAKSQNVGVVFVAGAGATLEAAANSCHDQGYSPQFVTYSLAIQDSISGNPNLEFAVGASPTFPWMLKTGPAAEYGDALKRYAPNLVTSGASSQVWTAGKLLEAASTKLPANPNSSDIIAGLRTLKGNNLGGLALPLTFSGTGANNQKGCYFLVQVLNKKWTAPHGFDCLSS